MTPAGIGPDTFVQVVLPVHNEAGSIEATLRELSEALAGQARVELVICEDGSTDGTRSVLERLQHQLPLRFVFGSTRKGYARAVVDGLRVSSAPWVLCLDSDGQCDPADFATLRQQTPTHDLVKGWRVRRSDTAARRLMSGLFRLMYRQVLRVSVTDPSCPFILVSRPLLDRVLADKALGRMSEGFWWEFVARAIATGSPYAEVPVRHRPRAAGGTRVFGATRLPAIFARNVWALWQVRRDVGQMAAGPGIAQRMSRDGD